MFKNLPRIEKIPTTIKRSCNNAAIAQTPYFHEETGFETLRNANAMYAVMAIDATITAFTAFS